MGLEAVQGQVEELEGGIQSSKRPQQWMRFLALEQLLCLLKSWKVQQQTLDLRKKSCGEQLNNESQPLGDVGSDGASSKLLETWYPVHLQH